MVLVFSWLHLEYIGDDTVNLDVANQAREEEVFQCVSVKRAEWGEKEKKSWESVLIPRMDRVRVVHQLGHHLVLQALYTVVV